MASLTRPLSIKQALCPACKCSPRIRNFTSTTSRTAQAMKAANVSMKQMAGQLTGMKSLKSEMKNATRSQLPDDFGLMPQTFVLPKREELPSIFKQPGRWWKIFYNVQKMKVMRVFGLYYLFWWRVKRDRLTGRRQTTPTEMGKRKQTARELHSKLYTAVANGDLDALKSVARGGLRDRMKTQIEKRKGQRLIWEVQYVGRSWTEKLWWPISTMLNSKSTRILSDVASPLEMEDSMLRQIVVRLTTRQRIIKEADKAGRQLPEWKTITENLVLQRLKIRGQWDDWMIWGTIEPNKLEELERIIEGTAGPKGISFMDRVYTSSATNAMMRSNQNIS